VMVAYVYNHSYLGGWVQEDCLWRLPHTKSLWDSHFNQRLGMVVCTCHHRFCKKDNIGGLWSKVTWAKSETLSPK
jgi:hypothetical protein